MSRRCAWLAVAPALVGGCFLSLGHGYEWVTPRPTPAPARGAVLIYRIDRGAPESAPPGCTRLGTVRAWSQGEKTFPYSEFRAAAEEVGGDGVTDVRPDPAHHEPSPAVHLGEVVRCAAD